MGTYVMTGGATGIGAEIRQRLLAAGHDLIVIDLKNADYCVDLSNRESTQACVQDIAAKHRHIDGIITCAGVASHFPDKRKILEINYTGSIDIIDGLVGNLETGGRVVVVSSNSAPQCSSPTLVQAMLDNDWTTIDGLLDSVSGHDCYSGSKQAIAKWMRQQAPGLARKGININAVAPGYIDTPMTQAVAQNEQYGAAIKQFVASIPLGRPGLPSDIANAVDFLLSPASSFVAGSVLFIDGGHDAMFRPNTI
jgi:NAD(P)-dependent dehydrogenase (short-subunit alcohol dehydrogenase family)